jgi:hypothetical protein
MVSSWIDLGLRLGVLEAELEREVEQQELENLNRISSVNQREVCLSS